VQVILELIITEVYLPLHFNQVIGVFYQVIMSHNDDKSLIFGYALLHYCPLHWAWCVHNVSTLVPKQHLQPHVLFKINIEWMWVQLVIKWGHCNCEYSRSLGNDLDNSYHGCVGAFMLWEIWPLKTVESGTWWSTFKQYWQVMNSYGWSMVAEHKAHDHQWEMNFHCSNGLWVNQAPTQLSFEGGEALYEYLFNVKPK